MSDSEPSPVAKALIIVDVAARLVWNAVAFFALAFAPHHNEAIA